jgi:hypothetical protein
MKFNIPKGHTAVAVLVLLKGENEYGEALYCQDGQFRWGLGEPAIVDVEDSMPLPTRDSAKTDSDRISFMERKWVSVSCRVANTGFCGPRGREWQVFVYAATARDPKSAEGETLREAIDLMMAGDR